MSTSVTGSGCTCRCDVDAVSDANADDRTCLRNVKVLVHANFRFERLRSIQASYNDVALVVDAVKASVAVEVKERRFVERTRRARPY